MGVVGNLSYNIYSKEAKRRLKTMVNSESSRTVPEKCIFPIMVSPTKAHISATTVVQHIRIQKPLRAISYSINNRSKKEAYCMYSD